MHIVDPVYDGDPIDWCIDAGLVPLEPRGEVRITDHDLMLMSQEELSQLNTLVLHTNQWVLREEDLLTRDIIIRWKFDTPCITDLEEVK